MSTEFSSTFQREVLALMFNDPAFRKVCADILEPVSFDNRIDAAYAGIMLEFHKKYPTEAISRTVIFEEIKKLRDTKRINETELPDYTKVFVEIFKPPRSSGYIRDKVLEFGMQKAIEVELINTADRLKKGTCDKVGERFIDIERKFSKKLGMIEDFKIVESMKDRIEGLKDPDALAKKDGHLTSVAELDASLYRTGVGSGEMIVICGSPGRGKSIFLVNMAAIAMIKGYNVLFYTLEVSSDIVLNRFTSCVTGVPFVHLSGHAASVERRWDSLSKRALGEIFLRDLPPRFLTPDAIRNDLRYYREKGENIDMLAVDYADIMSSDKKIDERRLEHGDVYEQLRAIAKEFKVCVITASQANRDSLRKVEVDIDSMSEDFSKAMTADYVIGLSQTKSELVMKTDDGRGTGKMRLFIAKNRNGVKGLSIPVMTDFTCMRVSIEDWDALDGMYLGI